MSSDFLEKKFRPEVWVSELIRKGEDINNIMIFPKGVDIGFKYKEFPFFSYGYVDLDSGKYACVYSERNGIYDALPEGIFHRPLLYNELPDAGAVIRHLRKSREVEQEARTFLLPVDIIFNRCRLDLLISELEVSRVESAVLQESLSACWEIFNYLDHEQSKIALHHLPLMSSMRGDAKEIAVFFSRILGVKVKMDIVSGKQETEIQCAFLGDGALGISSILGHKLLDNFPVVKLDIGPVPEPLLPDFLPGGHADRLTDLLCKYLLDADLPVEKHLNTAPELKASLGKCYLDINAFL